MVEQSRKVAPAGAAARRPSAPSAPRVGGLHVLAGGEHGDDHLRVPHGLLRAVRHGDPVFTSDIERSGDHVETGHGDARLNQVHGHRPAHVPQPQERYARRGGCR